MQEPRSDDFPLCLLQQHVVGSERKTLLPASYWGAQEELARLTEPAQGASGHGVRRVKPADRKYPATFDGACVVVKVGDFALELSVLCASVFTASDASKKAFVAIQEFQNHHRFWPFAVNTDSTTLPSIVRQLISAGAILVDVLSPPLQMRQISTGRTTCYSCRNVVFFAEEDDTGKKVMTAIASSYSATSGNSSEGTPTTPGKLVSWGSRRQSPAEPHDDRLPQDSAPQSPSPVHTPEHSEGTEEEMEEEGIRWVTKFYNMPSEAMDDECDDPFMLPGSSPSSSSQDGAPMADQEVLKEFRILIASQKSNRILKIAGLFRMPDPVSKTIGWTLISEYCSGGTMTGYLKQRKMFEPDAKKVAYGLLAALEFLHQRAIVHRNIKLDHVLLKGDDNEIVLCGFGSASFLAEIDSSAQAVGTLGYMAPETIQFNTSREPADIFAAGVVVFCALSCHKPFGGSTPAELTKHSTVHKEVDFSRQKAFKNVSDECKEFIKQLLIKSPSHRLTASQALDYSWLFAEREQDQEQHQPQLQTQPTEEESHTNHQPAMSSSSRPVAEPKRLADVRASSSPKAAAVRSDHSRPDEDATPSRGRPSPALQGRLGSDQANSRRSRSLIQRFRERTIRLFPTIPLGRDSTIRQYDEAGETFVNISPTGHQPANTPRREGRHFRSSVGRALSAIRSVMPTSGNTADTNALQARPFTGLDGN